MSPASAPAESSRGPAVPEELEAEEGRAFLLSDQAEGSAVKSRHFRAGVALTLLGGFLVVLAYRTQSTPTPGSFAGLTELTAVEKTVAKDAAPAQCSAPGENCMETQCCIDGGSKGYRCFGKNADYGECMESCEPGVHDGEKESGWDEDDQAYGLVKWKCKAFGEQSRPGCDSFEEEKECPVNRCGWGESSCLPKCGDMPSAGACWGQSHCMWEGDKCQGACWEVDTKDACSSLSRCQWLDDPKKGGSCGLACHVHGDEDCPGEEQCMVADGKCQQDPCSAQWEDCRETKCCSGARGALGMTCFEKDKEYATCLDMIDPKYQKGWTGKKLGNRTRFDAGCTWAGQECSSTHTCCNDGFNCAVKDETFAGCALSQQVSTFSREEVDLPAGWEGTVLGGWRGEYAVDPVPEGADMAGVTMFCMMVVLPDSPEVDLLGVARSNNASIFQCEAHKVYHSWKTDSAGWDTAETTLVNTAVFLQVFKWVRDDGEYLKHDWTVKVDPDCVFLPERLRGHLYGLRPPPDTGIYLKNNNVNGMGNNNFLGAMEVFSKRAVQIYLDNDDDCGKYLGTNSGEDGFFKGCMDALGVGFMWDHDGFKPNFDPAICTNPRYAAYHPMKYASHWQRCWDIATGKMCQDVTYDCGDPLDPPISSAGIR